MTTDNTEHIDQVLQKELGITYQEFLNLDWKKTVKFPVTFRGTMPPDNKEMLFEAKSWDEFYLTVADMCYAEPLSKEEGQKLLISILNQQERLTGMPVIMDGSQDNS